MTKELFVAFFPQFGGVSEFVIDEFVEQANLRFSDLLDASEEARRLYIAHKLTLYAQTSLPVPDGHYPGMTQLAGAGVAAQSLSKSVGGVSVSKSEGSAVSSISGYGELKQTAYGVQLISLIKASKGVRYIP